jgi:predicted nuclease of predicted toxin-antitoxin system
MKFLVDAQLPPALCSLLRSAGHDALHTRELPTQNRTPDEIINDLSLKEQRVVVSKDTDFYYSHLLQHKPWKLLLVRTGNMSTRDLKRLFEAHLPAIVQLLQTNSLVNSTGSRFKQLPKSWKTHDRAGETHCPTV